MIVAVDCTMGLQPKAKDNKKYDTKHYLGKKICLNFHLLRFSV
jgi:hypothetical protein